MKIKIIPKDLKGSVTAIPSKSVAHRALICAALSEESTKFNNLFFSKDIKATIDCITALGAEFEGGVIYPAKKNKKAKLLCNESGSTLRFMLPVALALGGEFEFEMCGRLPQRPLSPLYGELIKNGCTLSEEGKNPFAASGQLKSGVYCLPGDVSSQFITGLLLALPILSGNSEIEISGTLESAPYIDITRSVQKQFGVYSRFENNTFYINGNQKYKSTGEFTVEGDWSNGAFWHCANRLCGEVVCTGLDASSAQGDKEIVDILEKLPCRVDAKNIPDLIPAVCAVAATVEGETVIHGAKRLIIKESNRILAICDTLSRLGADITPTDDGMIIKGKKTLSGGEVQGFNDHRIVMMAAIASIKCTAPVIIEGAEAAEKSYPHFFEDFKKLGGEFEVIR